MAEKQNNANITNIKDMVSKMLKNVPEHRKYGTTIIKKNDKVYVFNYKRKKTK